MGKLNVRGRRSVMKCSEKSMSVIMSCGCGARNGESWLAFSNGMGKLNVRGRRSVIKCSEISMRVIMSCGRGARNGGSWLAFSTNVKTKWPLMDWSVEYLGTVGRLRREDIEAHARDGDIDVIIQLLRCEYPTRRDGRICRELRQKIQQAMRTWRDDTLNIDFLSFEGDFWELPHLFKETYPPRNFF